MHLSQTYQLKSGNTLLIRPIEIRDATAFIRLVANILTTTPFTLTQINELDQNVKAQEEWIASYIKNINWVVFVAELEGQLVGNIDFQNNRKLRNQHSGEFGMGVHADFRGIGIGKFLLNHFLDWAEENPILEKINLMVMKTNMHAFQLYKNAGFIYQGIHPKAIRINENEYVDVIEMYKWV